MFSKPIAIYIDVYKRQGIAHETIGTADTGCVRFCPGIYTSENDIDEAIAAVREISNDILST